MDATLISTTPAMMKLEWEIREDDGTTYYYIEWMNTSNGEVIEWQCGDIDGFIVDDPIIIARIQEAVEISLL